MFYFIVVLEKVEIAVKYLEEVMRKIVSFKIMNNIKNIIYIYLFFYYVKFIYLMKRFEEEDVMRILFD